MNPQFSLERRLAYRFSIMSTLNLRRIGSLYVKKFGLSAAGWRILSIIGRHEPTFPGVAAQLSTMDADKVTRAVDRLVDMGYVIRNTDAADRRRVILCLTSRGRSVYEEVEESSQRMDADWRSALTPEENRIFDAMLDKLEVQAQVLFTGPVSDPVPSSSARTPRRAAAKARSAPRKDASVGLSAEAFPAATASLAPKRTATTGKLPKRPARKAVAR
ncbi:MAG: MarR family winged helix-turn-helix transcriptional regulator [Pigmentiphaga sp.]